MMLSDENIPFFSLSPKNRAYLDIINDFKVMIGDVNNIPLHEHSV